MSESAATDRCPAFLSVPVWDISDEEISEWKRTPGLVFAGYTAAHIRDGVYANGEELFPPGSPVYQEIDRATVEKAMTLLAERGMARKAGSRWHATAPGRMEPSIRRAVTILLDHRADLPPALAAELDTWTVTLDELQNARSGPAQLGRAA